MISAIPIPLAIVNTVASISAVALNANVASSFGGCFMWFSLFYLYIIIGY